MQWPASHLNWVPFERRVAMNRSDLSTCVLDPVATAPGTDLNSVIGVISWLLSRQSKNQTTKSHEAVIPFVVTRTGCRAIALHASSCILGLHDRLVRNPSTLSRYPARRLSQQRRGGAGVARDAGSRRWLLRKDDARRRRALEPLARRPGSR